MLMGKNVNGDKEKDFDLYALVRIFWATTKMALALHYAFTMLLYWVKNVYEAGNFTSCNEWLNC